ARVRVDAVGQRRREARVQQRALRQGDVEDVVEAVVEQDLRIEGHDHVDPEEQLAEALVDMEVDRPRGLLGRPRPVDVQPSPTRQIVSTILNGPWPSPSSSTQSVKLTRSSGMYWWMRRTIASRVRVSSASQAAEKVVRPNRSQISTTRRSAARQP